MSSPFQTMFKKVYPVVDRFNVFWTVITFAVTTFSYVLTKLFGFTDKDAIATSISVLALCGLTAFVVTLYPRVRRERQLREASANPHLRFVEDHMHISYLRKNRILYRRTLVAVPTQLGVEKYHSRLSAQGLARAATVTSQQGCRVEILEIEDDTGTHVHAHFDNIPKKGQEFIFSYEFEADNSVGFIKNYLAHGSLRKPDRKVVLEVTLSSKPRVFIETEYLSYESDNIRDRRRIEATTNNHMWPIDAPDTGVDYRLTWE